MKIKTWQVIVVIISLILGTLLHFTYEWSGRNTLVGVFSAVNESTWEHLKLTFYPMLLMAIIGYFVIGEQSKNYWASQAIGIFVAIAFITIFFYTYTGITGVNIDILNIGSFIVAVILGQYITYRILASENFYNVELMSIILLSLLLLIFILYTFNPPQIPYFKDPINGTYAIQ